MSESYAREGLRPAMRLPATAGRDKLPDGNGFRTFPPWSDHRMEMEKRERLSLSPLVGFSYTIS
jgi:hypothetical protein